MDLSLRELQMLAGVDSIVEDARADLRGIVEFFKGQPYYKNAVQVAFVNERQLPMWLAEEIDVFFVDEDTAVDDLPEKYRHEALGMVRGNRVLFAGRLVYPVKDVKGQIMGFCGWDKFIKPKYLDSVNSYYKAKETTFFGMEMLPEYYRSDKLVYAVEGIVCCLYLRSIGLQAIALLGSSVTKYVLEILKRFRGRLVVIPDNDVVGNSAEEMNGTRPAGEHLVKIVKKNLREAVVVQSKIAKDVDDTRKFENGKYETKFINELKSVVNPFQLFETIRVR